jgi:hypothetical protein
MITQEQFDNLQVGDILKNDTFTLEVCGKFHKAIIGLVDNSTYVYSLDELNERLYTLTKPIKYNQGFEVRKYPERPVVLVGNDIADKLRFLVEVTEGSIYILRGSTNLNRFSEDSNHFIDCKVIKALD